MKEEQQQAVAAIKSGHEDQARVLLAQLLKDDPAYVPGWVLLSKLAPNNLQKAAFLEKILSLDPDHAYARQEMEALGAGAAAAPGAGLGGLDMDEALEEAPVVAPPEVRAYGMDEGVMVEELEADYEAGEMAFEPREETSAVPVSQQVTVSEEPLDFDAQAAGETLPPWLAEDEELLAAEAGGDGPGEADRMPPEPELPDWLKEEQAAATETTAPAGGKVRVREGAAAVASERPVPARRPTPAPRSGPPAWLIYGLIVVLLFVFLLLVYFGIRYFT
jgi:hypothetical protein